MPCLSASLPVEIEVHNIGDSGGSSVARFPITPLLTIFSNDGINPWSIKGLITFQSAASQPINNTRLAILLLIVLFFFLFTFPFFLFLFHFLLHFLYTLQQFLFISAFNSYFSPGL